MLQNTDRRVARLVRISFLFFILLLAVFSFFHRTYATGTGLDALSAYFYPKAEWDSVIAFLRNEHFLNYEAICAYHVYLVLDFFFILFYTILLYRFALQFKGYMKLVTLALTAALIASDVTENICWWQEENTPMLSGIKMILVFALLLIALNHSVGRYVKNVKAILYTLWYCRLSLVTLLLMSVLILNPQGKDLLVFMFEHEQAVLFLIGFNAVSAIAGVVCWYAPRFLFPENPPRGKEYSLLNYSDWDNHFDLSSYRTDSDEQKALREAKAEQLQIQRQESALPAETIPEPITLESAEASRRLRIYIPIVISLAFYAMLTGYFFSMWLDLSNATHTNAVASLIVSMSVAALIASLFTSPGWWKRITAIAFRAITGNRIDHLIHALCLIAVIFFFVAAKYKDTVSGWELFGQGLLLIAQGLFILSIAHLKSGGAWQSKPLKTLQKLSITSRKTSQSGVVEDSAIDDEEKRFLATKQKLHVTILLSLPAIEPLIAVQYMRKITGYNRKPKITS